MSQDVNKAGYQKFIDRKSLPKLDSSVGTSYMIHFNSQSEKTSASCICCNLQVGSTGATLSFSSF